MALIDRVKERIETSLLDPELQRLIDEANLDVITRWGPDAAAQTVQLRGGTPFLDVLRSIDTAAAITIKERVSATADLTTLAANDYRVLYRGRTIERLRTGTNARTIWGDEIEVTYTPISDGNQRQEVIIKLVQLAVEFKGVSGEKVGDVSTNYADYWEERDRLLKSLGPRPGLMMA